MAQSKEYSFNNADWKAWGINFLRFVLAPTAVAFLLSWQGQVNLDIAWGVAVGTFYTSVIDFIRKFIAG